MSRSQLTGIVVLLAGCLTLGAGRASGAGTFYWGGGVTNIANGAPLKPTVGTWNTTTQNWGDAASGPANYSYWTNDLANTASFGLTGLSYTVSIPGIKLVAGGLSTYAQSGLGTGVVTINASAANANLTVTNGGTINVAPNTTLSIYPNPGSFSFNAPSGCMLTGGGTLLGGGFASGSGAVLGLFTIDNATLTIREGGWNNVFQSATAGLASATSVLNVNVTTDNGTAGNPPAAAFAGVTGAGGTIRTTVGTGLVAGVMLNNAASGTLDCNVTDGGFGGLLALYKDGAGTLTVTHPGNSYSGGTYVFNGRLVATGSNAVPGFVGVGGGTFESQDTNGQPPSVVVQAGGTAIGRNLDLSRVTVLSGGILLYNAMSDIPGTGRVLLSQDPYAAPGAIVAAGFAADNTFLQRFDEGFDGVIALTTNNVTDLDFSSSSVGGNFASARLGAVGNDSTNSGALTASGTYRLGGGTANLTLSRNNALTGANNLEIWPNAAGGGGIILPATNNLSGSLTVKGGAALTLWGTNGALPNITSATLRGGTLALTDPGLTTPDLGPNANRLPDTMPLVVTEGGSFSRTGAKSSTEVLGALQLNGGMLALHLVNPWGNPAAYQYSGLQFDSVSRVNKATLVATLDFVDETKLAFVNATENNTILGGWAVWYASRHAGSATNSGTGPIWSWCRQVNCSNWPTMTPVTSQADWNGVLATHNADLLPNLALTGSRTCFSLRLTGPAAAWTNSFGATDLINLVCGGLLVTTGGVGTVTNGYLTAGGTGTEAGWTNDLVVTTPVIASQVLTLYSTIIDNAAIANAGSRAVALVKSGVGRLNVYGTNTYSGGTYLNAGLLYGSSDSAWGSGPVYLTGFGGTLGNANTVRTWTNAFVVMTSATIGNGSQSLKLTGPFALTNNATLTLSSGSSTTAITNSGAITGQGGLLFSSPGIYALDGAGANTYTGLTVLTHGTLTLNKSGGVNAIGGDLQIGGVDRNLSTMTKNVSLAASEQIADSAVVSFVGGNTVNAGTLTLNGYSETVAGLRSAWGNGVVQNGGGGANASTLTLSGAGVYTFGGLLRNDAAGSATNILRLVKSGGGTQKLLGASTYAGGTRIDAGALYVDNTSGSGTGTGPVTNNATLGGSGAIGGAVTVNAGAKLDPGSDPATAGTLTVNSNVTFVSGSGLTVDLAGSSAADCLVVNGTGSTLNLGSGLSLYPNALGAFHLAAGSSWTIARVTGGATITGTLPAAPGGWRTAWLDAPHSGVVLSKTAPGSVIVIR